MTKNFTKAEKFTQDQLLMLQMEFSKKKKDPGLAYILWVWGMFGLHKFYLENIWGALWRILSVIAGGVFHYLSLTSYFYMDSRAGQIYSVIGWICLGIFAVLQIKDLLLLPKEIGAYNDQEFDHLMNEIAMINNQRNAA